jgi:hypothetical protein
MDQQRTGYSVDSVFGLRVSVCVGECQRLTSPAMIRMKLRRGRQSQTMLRVLALSGPDSSQNILSTA